MLNLQSFNPFASTIQATTDIVDLRVYPIKSCRGVSVPSTFLTRKGLEFDRQWMFVNAPDNKFVTIRDISELTLIDTGFTSSPNANDPGETDAEDNLDLVISVRDQPSTRISIPARPTNDWLERNTSLEQVEIWKVKTDAWVYSAALTNPITSSLVPEKELRLVYKGPTARILRGNGAPSELGREESTNFPDVLPLQIANAASMVELNSRLKARSQNEITIERFRPNIIVRGGIGDNLPAWEEDGWKTVRVVNGAPQSGTVLRSGPSTLDIDVVARCGRCQVPNVDPATSEKNKHEPWDTLYSYRRVDEGLKYKPCFGMLCAPRNEGIINVGMKFEVLETTEKHFYLKGF